MSGSSADLRIASRGSDLALVQSRWAARMLRERAGAGTDLRIVRTTGDRITDVPLARIGNRGLFTKELDEAVLSGEADLAVHSMKDVPTTLPDGLVLIAIGEREDPRDVLVVPPGSSIRGLDDLAQGARIGTSALRRRAQLGSSRPDLCAVDVRGNLDTRLRKLDEGAYDALVLAAAGLHRSGRADRATLPFDPLRWLPAVGQGALGAVCREDDEATRRLLSGLGHDPTATAVVAERAFLRTLEGGCQVPIGAHARVDPEGAVSIVGLVASTDGATVIRGEDHGRAQDAEGLGRALAGRLLDQGAAQVLDAVRAEFEQSSS